MCVSFWPILFVHRIYWNRYRIDYTFFSLCLRRGDVMKAAAAPLVHASFLSYVIFVIRIDENKPLYWRIPRTPNENNLSFAFGHPIYWKIFSIQRFRLIFSFRIDGMETSISLYLSVINEIICGALFKSIIHLQGIIHHEYISSAMYIVQSLVRSKWVECWCNWFIVDRFSSGWSVLPA